MAHRDRPESRGHNAGVRGLALLLGMCCALPIYCQIVSGSLDVKWSGGVAAQATDRQAEPGRGLMAGEPTGSYGDTMGVTTNMRRAIAQAAMAGESP